MSVVLALVAFVLVVNLEDVMLGVIYWPYAELSYLLLGSLFVGWSIWYRLEPRPIIALRVLAGIAGCVGLGVTFACGLGSEPSERYELALQGYGIVALALYAEICRALLDRWDHRSELVPRMRARHRSDASIRPPAPLPPS